MTEANKQQSAKHTSHQKNSSGYGKLILLLIAIITLGAYLLIDPNPKWLQATLKQNASKSVENQQEVNGKITDNSLPKSDETKECLMPETLPTSTDEIVAFAPKEAIEGFPADDSTEVNPYETIETSSNEAKMANENLVNNLNDCRIYLANANEMIFRFSKDIDYSDNLAIVTQLDFPPNIKEIVAMLEAYNKMIADNKTKSERVLLFNTNIFDKFLKINKNSSRGDEMKELKSKIDREIDLLNGYIFSSDLQEMFLK